MGAVPDIRLSTHSIWTALSHRIEHAAFRLAGSIFRALPVETASRLSGALWRRFAPLSHRHGRALANLARAFPEKSPREREAIVRAMWDNLGRTFGESFHLEEIARSGRVIFSNPEVLEAWAAQPGGKVACAGHLANWELAILGVSRQNVSPWSVYRPAKNPLVDEDIRQMRLFLYTNGGLLPKSPALPRSFLKLAREGATLGFLADQRDNGGVRVPLFGMPAPSTTFPALLARSTGVPILMVRMRRLEGVRFVQSFEVLPLTVTDDRKHDIETATALVQSAFERYIRAAPEQWMWAHRRWG